jgi:APA family basic amino acid/polyamine antiporter
VHPRFHTPHVITGITGIFVAFFAALFPVDVLADISNAGTLFAFAAVALGVLILRKTEPNRARPFKTPLVWVIGPLAILGSCLLFFSLGWNPTIKFFCMWSIVGLIVYYLYARRRSHLAPGNEHLLHSSAEPLEADPLIQQGPNDGP